MVGKPKYINEVGCVIGECIFLGENGSIKIGKFNNLAGDFICGFCQQKFRAVICKVRNKHIKSCGCIKKEPKNKKHGFYGTPEYLSWSNAKRRCYDKKNNRYYSHGLRGIVMCKGWKESFTNFINSMSFRPSKEHSLDRIDNDFNYSCGHCEECLKNGWKLNCRWANDEIQANNKRRSIFITFNGETLTTSQWEKKLGLGRGLVKSRYRRGLSVDMCLSEHRLSPTILNSF